jgi:carbon monoxide dehydrogenase subunit G
VSACYAALNDPEILKECIPGCEELTKHSDTELEAKVTLKIGPVKAKFGGNVTLDNSNAPDRFSLTGEGSGGVAGFAKGGADVELEEDGDATDPALHGQGRCRGKDRPARWPVDQLHREPPGRTVFQEVQGRSRSERLMSRK